MAQFEHLSEQMPEAMAQATDAAQAPMLALPLEERERAQALSAQAMRCGGCGAKVSANVLTRVLGRLQAAQNPDVLLGLQAGDDAAVLRLPPGQALVQSVDFFRAFIDDPYVFGRIAANHALGDVFAMGGRAHSALALATVPPGLESRTEDLLLQMMSGALAVLAAADCALIGGHTGEGRELALGFSVNGLIPQDLQGLMRKDGLKAGDSLILSKPMGTGTLLVAHQRLRARGRWIDAALQTMMQSSQQAGPRYPGLHRPHRLWTARASARDEPSQRRRSALAAVGLAPAGRGGAVGRGRTSELAA